MRRSISLGLSVLFLATCAWAQRRGAIGTAGGFRGGAGFARPQTFRPSPAIGNNSFRNQFPVSSLIGEGVRHRRHFVFSPFFLNGFGANYFYSPYYNSYYPCANPYSLYPSYCPPRVPYGPLSYGAGPDTSYGSNPQDMTGGDYQGGYYQDSDRGQQETTGAAPNPPSASSSRRVNPRDVKWILDDRQETSSTAGSPITIGSGTHSLHASIPDSEQLPPATPAKNPTE
jgi:hypothetical protein